MVLSRYRSCKQTGFSLVELSIVLVILGLLVGGILSGQSLIHAAELRSVSTQYAKYYAALQSFRDKYFAAPGDMTNATAFWGAAHATPATCLTTVGTGTQTCNGDGNNILTPALVGDRYGEIFTAWQHLANAGLIEGTYTGRANSGGGYDALIGTNIPASKIGSVGWSFYYHGVHPGSTEMYAGDWGNTFAFGKKYNAILLTDGSGLNPEDSWNIDAKVDDGKPGTGRLIARENGSFGNANSCTTSASSTDYAGSYKVSNTNVICAFYFVKIL